MAFAAYVWGWAQGGIAGGSDLSGYRTPYTLNKLKQVQRFELKNQPSSRNLPCLSPGGFLPSTLYDFRASAPPEFDRRPHAGRQFLCLCVPVIGRDPAPSLVAYIYLARPKLVQEFLHQQHLAFLFCYSVRGLAA